MDYPVSDDLITEVIMNIKRVSAMILSLLILLLSFSACKGDENSGTEMPETPADYLFEEITQKPDLTPEAETAVENKENISESDVSEISDDPSQWSVAQIVEAYKNAAAKSETSVKTDQVINLNDVSINNGQYEGAINFVMPIMSKLLANNAKTKDGITGGYENLTEADVASAKAYKSGNYTAIELVMKEQTSGARSDAESGSVGHAVTAVGDIGKVVDQLVDLGLPIEISEKDTKIHYTKPVVKVLVDGNGKIVKGTWSYTVDIGLNNCKVGGKTVETTSVVLDNIITVNGGF